MSITIATTNDSESQMRAALDRRGGRDHSPLPIDTTLTRRRSAEPKDEVVITTVESREQPDGSTEHGAVTSELYRNGELVERRIPTAVTRLLQQSDPHANARRQAEAEEMFSDHAQIISQDAPLPESVLIVCANHPRGQWLAHVLGRDPAARERLNQKNETSSQAAALEAIQMAEALTVRHFSL